MIEHKIQEIIWRLEALGYSVDNMRLLEECQELLSEIIEIIEELEYENE